MMSRQDTNSKLPAESSNNSPQLNIYQSLISPSNDPSELANIIYTWDRIPKYHISTEQQSAIHETGTVEPQKFKITLGNDVIDIKIQPALLEDESGNTLPYFPSETEELVEDVIRKFLADERYGVHQQSPMQTWVKFSYRMIRNELRRIGKARSHSEVRRAIEVMNKSHYEIKRNGKSIHSGPIFPDRIDAPNEESRAEDNLSAVQLSNTVSLAISKLDFFQYDYQTLSSLKNQLSRWVMRRLSYEYRNAGTGAPPHKVTLQEMVDTSLLFKKDSTMKVHRQKAKRALEHLKSKNVIMFYEEEYTYGADNRTVVDVLYKIHAHPRFTNYMKAANMRHRDLVKPFQLQIEAR